MRIGNIPPATLLFAFLGGICHALSWYWTFKIHADVTRTGGAPGATAANLGAVVLREYRNRFPSSKLPTLRVAANWIGAAFYVIGIVILVMTTK